MVRTILERFAGDTGLTADRPPRRYLWTDAFAVCGYLGLHEETGADRWLDLARRLVDQVHEVLGRHRADDPRSGWISGMDEATGRRHPTAGGLRIGKPEPERRTDEPYDPRREWDRDGQYYHYVTRWMHALNRMWGVTGEATYHRWAVELAAATHEGFADRRTPGQPRLFWKMSIDLSRPLVPSMGQHDPVDGRIAVELLRASAPADAGDPDRVLDLEARELDRVCRSGGWATHDPLGAGGLLVDALRLVQLRERGRPLPEWMESAVFRDALASLEASARAVRLDLPASERLAFREIGLAIGLRAAARIEDLAGPGEPPAGGPGRDWLAAVGAHAELADGIEGFWSDEGRRSAESWLAHRDINSVMLATALSPDGYLR